MEINKQEHNKKRVIFKVDEELYNAVYDIALSKGMKFTEYLRYLMSEELCKQEWSEKEAYYMNRVIEAE